MDFSQLFEIQRQLDKKILENHNLQGRKLINFKVLALQVELGELANETRCFKYWSKKASSERAVILEEYVDCLHFILSIGLEIDFTNITVKGELQEHSLSEQFLGLFNQISLFYQTQSKQNYKILFTLFLSLGNKIGFTMDEVEDAYMDKNKVNHQRQEQNY